MTRQGPKSVESRNQRKSVGTNKASSRLTLGYSSAAQPAVDAHKKYSTTQRLTGISAIANSGQSNCGLQAQPTKELATSRDKKTAAAPKFQSTLTAMAGLSYTQKQLLNNHAYAQLKASQQNYFQKPIESKDRRMKDP